MVGTLISGFSISRTPRSLEVLSRSLELQVIKSHLYLESDVSSHATIWRLRSKDLSFPFTLNKMELMKGQLWRYLISFYDTDL
jgi:hypothetical protein